MNRSVEIIHSIWIGPNPAPKIWMDSVVNFSKKYDYRYILWDKQRVEKFPMKNLKHFEAAESWAGKADILRYEILQVYGGIYMDADTVVVHGSMLDQLLRSFKADSAFGYENEEDGRIANGVIVAKPQSAFMQALIDAIPLRDHSKPAWVATGPVLVTDVYQSNKTSIDVCVFPRTFFYPQTWHGISSLDLHKRVKIPPESMLFQYGYSTNNLGRLIGPDGYALEEKWGAVISLLCILVGLVIIGILTRVKLQKV